MNHKLLLLIILLSAVLLSAYNSKNIKDLALVETHEFAGNRFSLDQTVRSNDIPDSILVFLVQFEDVKFDTVADFPDFIAHDEAYFHRLMFHLSSYWSDASYGNYQIVNANDSLYTIYDEIITLPNTMSYYGEDEDGGDIIERKVELVTDLLAQVDPVIDFNDYDTYMLFHAGAGQEAHGEAEPELLYSTFLSRKSFQAALDPENDEFPGVLTEDGTYFTEITIFPESENLPDISEDDPIYGLLGIIAQGFGYQLGLPTLFDNVSSNGRSAGIGSFGIMGWGVWNAAGYVPPLPCAWSRYFMGWEDDNLVEITSDVDLQEIAYPQHGEEAATLCKVNITDKEYFLIENRQQNPDDSYFVNIDGDTLVTFTFTTIEGQEVYEEGHPYAGQPKFMFMENTYAGCEWDFYLPGYGFGDDPANDGSGILIWHVDENIIAANFSEDFTDNSVNGDETHKGVDLEEADGVQNMDQWGFFGDKDDSFREGNNNYFGKLNPQPGVVSLPTSESYYGGSQLEIYEISPSDQVMTFSVRFEWFLDGNYSGENPFNAALVNFDEENDLEIFYPMPDGSIYLWKNFLLQDDYPISIEPLAAYYAYDEFSQTFILPTFNEEQGIARACFLNKDEILNPPFLGLVWAANPVIDPDENSFYRAFLPFNEIDVNSSHVKLLDSFLETNDEINFENQIIATNLMLKQNILYSITRDETHKFWLNQTNLNDLETTEQALSDLTNEVNLEAALLADIDSDLSDELIVTTADTLLFLFELDGTLKSGFPLQIPLLSTSLPALSDVDKNGYLDIIIGGINNFAIIDKNGNITGSHSGIEAPDSLYSSPGMIVLDIDNDGQQEVVGCMSKNRFAVWENLNNNTFEMKRNYPFSLGDFCANYPIPVNYQDAGSAIYFAAFNGTIYRQELDIQLPENGWFTEYGDLQRTATYRGELPINSFVSDKILLKDETYIYPNPLSVIFDRSIFNGQSREMELTVRIMTGIDTEVKLRVFDIAGNLILTETKYCNAYIKNNIPIDAEKLASGIYFANLTAGGEIMKLKFAIEK